jgi:hypothetical protein
MMKGSVWVVTSGINEYNQDGEYFVAVFKNKPSFVELKELLPNADDVTLGKLTRGGGRHEW